MGDNARVLAADPTMMVNTQGDLNMTTAGRLRVDVGGAFGSSILTTAQTALFVAARQQVWDGTNWSLFFKPTNTNRLASAAASANATLVKNAIGALFRVTGYVARSGSPVYLALYSKATAPVPGTDVPLVVEYLEPLKRFDINLDGLTFPLGIGFALTTDGGSTAVAAGDVLSMNVLYA